MGFHFQLMKTKALLCFGVVFGLSPLTLMGWWWWDSSENHGLNFGYYGVFNRVRHALSGIPGVTITREWANNEVVTIEQFGFDITTNSKKIALGFGEADPFRDLSGERLTRALTEKIQTENSSGRTAE